MKKLIFITLLACVFLAGISADASATLLTFDTSYTPGISLSGNMRWHGTGGGHLYMEQYNDDDFIYFDTAMYVNSFEMNAMPWLNYGGGNVGLVSMEAFDIDDNSLWNQTLDLSSYSAWDNWVTVDINAADVKTLAFYSPKNTHQNGFWPSIDNMIIDEAYVDDQTTIPEPATLTLLASGLLVAFIRKRS